MKEKSRIFNNSCQWCRKEEGCRFAWQLSSLQPKGSQGFFFFVDQDPFPLFHLNLNFSNNLLMIFGPLILARRISFWIYKNLSFFKYYADRTISLGQGLFLLYAGLLNLNVTLALVNAQLSIICVPFCCLGCKLCPKVNCVHPFLPRCKPWARHMCVG